MGDGPKHSGKDSTSRLEDSRREAQVLEQRFGALLEAAPDAMLIVNHDGRIMVANALAETLFGYTREELLAESLEILVPERLRRRHLAHRGAYVQDPRPRPMMQLQGRHKDGTELAVEISLSPLQTEEGGFVTAAIRDATQRKRLEELRFKESEEQYRLLFDSNPHPMWVFDKETLAFLAVNDAAVRQYGYSREEFLRMTAGDIRPPEEVPALLRSIEQAEPTRAGEGSLFRHRRKDGTLFQAEVASNSILFRERAAYLVLAVDVTEKRSLEAQLLQAQKMESVGRLAGGVAHDFNNLLGVITGYGELLRKRLPANPQLQKYTDDILKAAQRAADLTRQLLAFSRRQVLLPRILDLNVVVVEMEKLLRRLIGEDIQFVTVLDRDLEPVMADAGQIEQVLMNLVVNARDAMPGGGRLVVETGRAELDEVYAAAHAGVQPGRYAMLAVSDTGHGMSDSVRAHIFEPFFTTKESGKGTGLGLATVHGIVKQTGGHIYVYSEPGRGSTFKVYLPAAEEAPKPALLPPEEEVARGSETVLVVEDEVSLGEIVRESLESSGYSVLQAANALAALEISSQYPGEIHVLLTDVVMPALGGRELAAQLVAQRPGLKVLYMSGYTDDAVILHGVLSENVPFMEKPFTINALARKIREVLDQ